MVPRSSETRYTVGYRRKAPGRKPWALTNNESCHRDPMGVPWRSVEEARKGGALSGQDYVVGGAAGIGYGRISKHRQLLPHVRRSAIVLPGPANGRGGYAVTSGTVS